ncbi:Zn-dependent peptidase [Klebsormidium nitens]|uniref:Zn-dependent peptidase n=1 Tax=Klebsormidium nitens TaxID=105231 RepID=A0A1Y1HQK4_KLENI|nr:Zn-dependent peptidase [Klebsormidium nitens]|eukprot:GAQ80363.1 Zn-dependent peptidase [Klebsormidium nitens]
MALRQRPTGTKEPQEQEKSEAPSDVLKQARVRNKDAPEAASQLSAVLLLLMFTSAIVGVVHHAVYRVPKPMSERAPAHMFSEGRALQHVEALAGDIGIRLVGSDNHMRAAAYILEELDKIASIAGDHLRVEIDEQHISGTFWMNILTHNMAMEYENVTNIVLRISGANSNLESKAVLMNAHFDSAVGSPGASDCAQCVAVGLEIARLFAASPEAPPAPLIFLFNGAEETFSMGAHGFLSGHKWSDSIGAVINIESTGPGGPDLLFQAAGKELWPVRVYSEVVPYPRASVIAQDTFDMHVLPGDTDFRVFAQDFGNIPGVDVLSLLDSYAYHTTLDTPDRIRRGTVQAMGENLYALTKGLSVAPELNDPLSALPKQQAVFWDFLGYIQVYYPRWNALIFHLTPLAVLAVVPLFTSDHASGLRGMPRRFNAIVSGILQTGAAWVLAVIFAVGVAVLRVAVSGKPITWLAQPSVAALMYIPPALLGILLVQSLRSCSPAKTSSQQRALDFTGHWGSAVGFNALLSAVLIYLGVGGSYIFMFWAMVLLPGFQIATEAGGFQTLPGLAVYLTIAAIPMAQCFYIALTIATFTAQKIGASGNWPDPIGSYVGDVAIAIIFSLFTAIIAAPLAPVLRRWLATWRVMRALVVMTLIGTIVGSFLFPYTTTELKRLAVQHTIWTQGKKDVIGREFSLLTFDPLAPTFIFDQSPALREHFNVTGDEAFHKTLPNTWLGLFPLSEMVHRDVSLPEQSVDLPAVAQRKPFPRLKLIANEALENDRRRILVEINNGALGHAWRTINVTGPVVGWSLGNFQLPAPEQRPGGPVSYIARHAGGPGTEKWRFWIEAEGTKKVRIDLAVLKFDSSSELEKIKSSLPAWVDFIGLTSYISTWKV